MFEEEIYKAFYEEEDEEDWGGFNLPQYLLWFTYKALK